MAKFASDTACALAAKVILAHGHPAHVGGPIGGHAKLDHLFSNVGRQVAGLVVLVFNLARTVQKFARLPRALAVLKVMAK